jgi:ABC-type transport system involved in cytochrome c biogenesis permease subunit
MLPPSAAGGDWRSIAEVDAAITRPSVEGPDGLRARVTAEILDQLKEQFKENNIDPANFSDRQKQIFANMVNRRLAPRQAELADKLRPDKAPAAEAFVSLLRLYKAGQYDTFNRAVADYKAKYTSEVPAAELRRVGVEAFFNRFAPFYQCLVLYIVVFLLGCLSWIVGEPLRRAAVALALVAFVTHTAALLTRMYLMDRPLVFVTNLYSSAVFIGWLAAALGLAVEFLFRNGVGNVLTAVTASLSLVIAHFLGLDGDTLGVMQAVLDTNFWLATHVTVVTFGYAATYVAGFVGGAYILLGVLTPHLRGEMHKTLASVVYGIVCFATLLSFTGTVLGGIWADQSWGRFWGWDPKENGALLIVIWNALILHARWAGMVKQRGVAILAVLGNIVTTWSWFGTNQLGVGLHAYGFRSGMAFWIVASSLVFLGVAIIGAVIPQRSWQSFAVAPSTGPRPKAQGRRSPAKVGAT